MEVSHHKAFMPASQVDLRHIPDISIFLGEKFPVKILEIRKEKGEWSSPQGMRAGRARQDARQGAGRDRGGPDAPGDDHQRHARCRGAFADLGGVDGLIHIGDLSYERVKDPAEVVKVGDVVEVRVLRASIASLAPPKSRWGASRR